MSVRYFHSVMKRFCERTSLRVLPRCVESKSAAGKFLWTAVFLGLLAGLLVVSSLLITEYLHYRTHYAYETDYTPHPFPSITICPYIPLNERGLYEVPPFTPRWWSNKLDKYITNKSTDGLSLKLDPYKMRAIPYLSPLHYYQSFPNRSVTQKVGQQIEEVFASCAYTNSSDVSRTEPVVGYNCFQDDSLLKISLISVPQYFNCFTLSFVNSQSVKITAVFVGIHTGVFNSKPAAEITSEDEQREAKNILDDGQEYLLANSMESWKSGARILMHPHGVYPNVPVLGSDVSSGMVHDVQVYSVRRKNLEPPYGRCSSEIDKLNHSVEDKGQFYKYTESACMNQYLQNRIKSKCGCVLPNLPLAKEDEPTGYIARDKYPYCHKTQFRSFPYIFNITSATCAALISSETPHSLTPDNTDCPMSCNEFVYHNKITSAAITDSTVYYTTLRKHREANARNEYSNRTAQYMRRMLRIREFDAIDEFYQKGEYKQALRKLKKLTVHRNLVLLTIRRKGFHMLMSTQVPLFKLPSLLSMLGGLGSLFIGFNLFVIVELLELSWFATCANWRNKKTSRQLDICKDREMLKVSKNC